MFLNFAREFECFNVGKLKRKTECFTAKYTAIPFLGERYKFTFNENQNY